MRTAGVAFVLACLVSGLLPPIVRRFALKHCLFDDNVSARKIHGRSIPRLGGGAICFRDLSAGNAAFKLEYLGAASVGETALDQVKQVLETASVRLFGETPREDALPVAQGTRVVG
jgi:hypothetical protein